MLMPVALLYVPEGQAVSTGGCTLLIWPGQ